jgi:transposase
MVFRKMYNFRGFKIDGMFMGGEELIVVLDHSRKRPVCPRCGRHVKQIEEEHVRSVRDLDVSGLRCHLQFPVYKVHCRCGHRGFEKIDFCREYSRCTTRFEEWVAGLCPHMSIKEVSSLVMLDWKTVKTIDKESMRSQITSLDDYKPRVLGVDEVAYAKGHHYLTVVRDLDENRVVWVGVDRKEVTLDLFFAILGRERSKGIEAVVMDMWDPYIASVCKNTGADIVFDKFHIAKKVNECVDSLRRTLFRKAGKEERRTWKNKRFLVLSRRKNLEDEKKEALQQLLETNQPLYMAYLLKEQLLDILDGGTLNIARMRLETWKNNVAESGLTQFDGLVKTLDNYMYGVLAYFKHRITNAGSEGFNNKINLIKRRSYGLQDLEYFMLKILTICGKPSSNIRR